MVQVQKRWTDEEINFLKKHYPTKGVDYCMDKLNKSKLSIFKKCQNINIKTKESKRWTDEEIEFLTKNYPKYGNPYCSNSLKRSELAIIRKLEDLDIPRRVIPAKYQEENFIPTIIASKSYSDAVRKMGLPNTYGNRQTVKKYIDKWGVDISHFDYGATTLYDTSRYSLSEILVEKSPYPYSTLLKEKLFAAGLKQRKCEKCGQGELWMGEEMSLILDHDNGINNDNRLFNLKIYCPNCNATLETHCKGNLLEYEAKKAKRKSSSRAKIIKDGVIIKQKDFCSCGNEKETRAKLCIECYMKIPRKKVDRPPLEQLLQEVTLTSYLAVGRKYGVSDNAIKKWIKDYGGVPPQKCKPRKEWNFKK